MAPVTKELLFEVGQIVHHVRYDYRGVIVGYDATFDGEDDWYDMQTKGKGYEPTKAQPWYHVLVDGAGHQTYVAQQNLEPSNDRQPIEHPIVDKVFTTFLDGRYHKENLN